MVKELTKNEQDINVGFGSAASGSSIHCSMDSTIPGETIEIGKVIRLKGKYVGYNHDDWLGNDIILNRCIPLNLIK